MDDLPTVDERRHFQAESPDVILTANTIVGMQYRVRCFYRQPILEVKGQLYGLMGIPAASLHIIWRNKELNDYDTVEASGILDDTDVFVTFDIECGPLTTAAVDYEMVQDLYNVMNKIENLQCSDDVDNQDSPDISNLQALCDELNEVNVPESSITSAISENSEAESNRIDCPISPNLSEENKKLKNKINFLRKRLQKKKKIFPQPGNTPPLHKNLSKESHASFKLEKNYPPLDEISSESQISNMPKLPYINETSPGLGKKVLCRFCRKKLGICTTYKCRCGFAFCARHRYPESHECSCDYKTKKPSAKSTDSCNAQGSIKFPKI